ncbi:MAG: hypothetical protein WCG98_00110 [bacterium]
MTEADIDNYLKTQIPALLKNTKFMDAITSPDQMVLALTGMLVAGNYFVA